MSLRTVHCDERGIFVRTNGAKCRPGAVVGYDHDTCPVCGAALPYLGRDQDDEPVWAPCPHASREDHD